MSAVPDPDDWPQLTILPPDEALRRARPLPAPGDLAIQGLTDEEWAAFEKALTDG